MLSPRANKARCLGRDRRQEVISKGEDVESEEEDDTTWALELEEELGLSVGTGQSSSTSVTESTLNPSPAKPANQSFAALLPQEVLVNILKFTQVGRVCKSWSLAMSTVSRRKFRERVYEVLQPFTQDAISVSHQIEEALFDIHGLDYSLAKAYNQKARQLLFNLRDARNAHLRDRVLSGSLPASDLVRLSASELANPVLVQQRKAWIRKRTHEVMRQDRALEGFTETDLFECRSCGSWRTRYRQWRRKAVVDRTRIIVMCLSCPNRWEL